MFCSLEFIPQSALNTLCCNMRKCMYSVGIMGLSRKFRIIDDDDTGELSLEVTA